VEGFAVSPQKSITEKNRANILGYLIIFAIGSFFFYFLMIQPLWDVHRARRWIKTPCVIFSSTVETHRGNKGRSYYEININYGYQFQGRAYQANRYRFISESSIRRKSQNQILQRYPRGTETFCYVNPDNPYEAVIDREFSSEMYFGLLPLIFVLIGLSGVITTSISIRKNNRAGLSGRTSGRNYPTPVPNTNLSQGPLVLKSNSTVILFVVLLILAAIVDTAIGYFYKDLFLPSHWPKNFIFISNIIIVLMGMVFTFGALYMFLSLFNPMPRLTLYSGLLCLGQTVDLEWRISGRTRRIRRLQIFLEGREAATHPSGKSSTTDWSDFYKSTLVDIDNPAGMLFGRVAFEIPGDTMHSFKSKHNEIFWTIRIKGEIRRWPDMCQGYPITILPPATH
jgi:hypothetical protein